MTKVLLVSSDANLEINLNISLRYNGYVIHSTSFADEAWKFLSEIRFDVIFLDVRFIDGTGFDFYRKLREKGLSLPVLIFGEGEFDAFMLKPEVSATTNFLIKPFKFRELRKKLDILMCTSRMEERIFKLGALNLDLRQHLLLTKNRIIQLGKTEMQILLLLAQRCGEAVELPRYQMSSFYYVSRLRQKLCSIADRQFEISLVGKECYQLSLKS